MQSFKFEMKLIILITLLIGVSYSEHIPRHLHKKLMQAKSFKDLTESFHVHYEPSHKQPMAVTSRASSSRRQQTPSMRIQSASILSGAHERKMVAMETETQKEVEHHVSEEMRADFQVMNELKQGNDTCKLQTQCVSTGESSDPQYIYYPKCVEVMRCIGSCCDSQEQCHPHSVVYKNFQIANMLYIGAERFTISGLLNITLEEHTSCSCYDCGEKEKTCPPKKAVNRDCMCACTNQGERELCTGGSFVWDEDLCQCHCVEQDCSSREKFNRDKCMCERRDVILPTDTDDEDEFVDISKLPRLKTASKRLRVRPLPRN